MLTFWFRGFSKNYFPDFLDTWCPTTWALSREYNKYKCAYGINETEQHAALMEMEKLLLSMKFGNANENRQRREKMQFQKGMICSIKGVLFLFDQLKKEGFKYLMTTKVIVSKIFYHLLRETISSFYNSFHTGKSRLLWEPIQRYPEYGKWTSSKPTWVCHADASHQGQEQHCCPCAWWSQCEGS